MLQFRRIIIISGISENYRISLFLFEDIYCERGFEQTGGLSQHCRENCEEFWSPRNIGKGTLISVSFSLPA